LTGVWSFADVAVLALIMDKNAPPPLLRRMDDLSEKLIADDNITRQITKAKKILRGIAALRSTTCLRKQCVLGFCTRIRGNTECLGAPPAVSPAHLAITACQDYCKHKSL